MNENRGMVPSAVTIKHAWKKYGKGVAILNNFNMTVQRGSIYGLLGASGCGKTTVLSCVVGLNSLDSGEISVLGTRPGSKGSGIPGKTTGYMPQEIALYKELTIKEILNYFGKIYDLTQTDISARVEFLVKFLDLPNLNQIIGCLSGGQQRRTSLAVAIIHDPQLIILDEPTVGVDPVIREKIWEYLREMVLKRKTTVIITTHYIEEAAQADSVGFMRNGRLLVEKSPQILLKEYETNYLQDVVLKLCKKDTFAGKDDGTSFKKPKHNFFETSFFNPFKVKDSQNEKLAVHIQRLQNISPSLESVWPQHYVENRNGTSAEYWNLRIFMKKHVNTITALAIKNFIVLLRNPAIVIFLLAIPTIQISLMNFILDGTPKDVKFGLVNHEFNTSISESCEKEMSNFCLGESLMSCTLTKHLSHIFSFIDFSSEEEALRNVELGNSWGYLSIPKNFTEHMKDRSMWKNFITTETIEGTTLTLRMDMSERILSSTLIGSLYENYINFIQKLTSDCGGDPRVMAIPLNVKEVYGQSDGKNVDYIQPGALLFILFFLPMANSISLVLDKKAGTLDRSMIAGVKFIHIFISSMISQLAIIILELVLCFGVATTFFQFTVEGSWLLVFLISILTSLCGLSFGFILGTICNHEIEALMLLMAGYSLQLPFSGLSWPVETVGSWWLRMICCVFPIYLPSEALRSIVSRGWGLTHPNVWPGFVTLSFWTIGLHLTGLILNKIKRK